MLVGDWCRYCRIIGPCRGLFERMPPPHLHNEVSKVSNVFKHVLIDPFFSHIFSESKLFDKHIKTDVDNNVKGMPRMLLNIFDRGKSE